MGQPVEDEKYMGEQVDIAHQRINVIAAELQQCSPGVFIAFEGGDGSGKTTQMQRLENDLQGVNAEAIFTREPGGSELGSQIRNLVMHGPEDIDPRTEALLYAADRAYHAATVITPALQSGVSVFTDRYIDSSIAYQGIGRELGIDKIRDLSLWATGGLLPDVIIIFDVDPALGLARAGTELDRLERAGNLFHERVRQHYLQAASNDPLRYRIIDASEDIDSVYEKLLQTLTEVLAERNARQ